jgi:hypothetical protein
MSVTRHTGRRRRGARAYCRIPRRQPVVRSRGLKGASDDCRLAQIQNCRSPSCRRGCRCLCCIAPKCSRSHTFSAISTALDLRAAERAQTRNRSTPPLRPIPGSSRLPKVAMSTANPAGVHFATHRSVASIPCSRSNAQSMVRAQNNAAPFARNSARHRSMTWKNGCEDNGPSSRAAMTSLKRAHLSLS